MIENLFLVTSIINIPNLPFSYTNIRSIYNMDERFEQTKKTLKSIKEKIPNSKILFIEYSELTENMTLFLKETCDYFINLYEDATIKNNIFGLSKALGEGTLTLKAIEYIEKNNIVFKNFFKISGRYFISDNFYYEKYNNNKIVVQKIDNDKNNISTFLYKLDYESVFIFKKHLIDNHDKMLKCIGYEVLFADFINQNYNKEKIKYIEVLGVNGKIAVSGDMIHR
jgi:hypothetical protein